MLVVGLILAALAAVLHIYIFVMESITWTSPRTRRTFGISAEAAEATKEMAFNQGFYNLFLAIVTVIGGVLVLTGTPIVGTALLLVGTGSMLGAALVLFLSSPDKRRAALTQGTFPLLAVIAVTIALAA